MLHGILLVIMTRLKEGEEITDMADVNQNSFAAGLNDDTVIFKERKRWLFLGLPWTFTKYTIKPAFITLNQGFFNSMEDDCYMYKIQDVKMNRSLLEKIFGLSTIVCYSGDVTNPELILKHIRHGQEIKNYILKTSEEARIKRRTIHTQDIGAHNIDLDGDGMPDNF